jgi:excisionase family DNA binding protein
MSTTKKKRQRRRPLPAANAFAFTIADAMAMGLPGKSTVYKLIKSGKLKTVRVNGRHMLIGDSVRELLGASEEDAA